MLLISSISHPIRLRSAASSFWLLLGLPMSVRYHHHNEYWHSCTHRPDVDFNDKGVRTQASQWDSFGLRCGLKYLMTSTPQFWWMILSQLYSEGASLEEVSGDDGTVRTTQIGSPGTRGKGCSDQFGVVGEQCKTLVTLLGRPMSPQRPM